MPLCANADELKGLLMGLSISTKKSTSLSAEIDFWMREFDADRSGSITYEEFQKQLGRCAQRSCSTCMLCLLMAEPLS